MDLDASKETMSNAYAFNSQAYKLMNVAKAPMYS